MPTRPNSPDIIAKAVRKPFDENKVNRDAGKFASKPGAGAKTAATHAAMKKGKGASGIPKGAPKHPIHGKPTRPIPPDVMERLRKETAPQKGPGGSSSSQWSDVEIYGQHQYWPDEDGVERDQWGQENPAKVRMREEEKRKAARTYKIEGEGLARLAPPDFDSMKTEAEVEEAFEVWQEEYKKGQDNPELMALSEEGQFDVWNKAYQAYEKSFDRFYPS